jgi:hypothetical protein
MTDAQAVSPSWRRAPLGAEDLILCFWMSTCGPKRGRICRQEANYWNLHTGYAVIQVSEVLLILHRQVLNTRKGLTALHMMQEVR